jgi:hypothetical protein
MNVKLLPLLLLSFLFAIPARAQESITKLKGPGQYNKFLTPGQIDRWLFDGEKGETIIAYVVSREFDPILELATDEGAKEDKVLLEVDDPGNESRFAIQLPDKGKYKIRVHAYKFQGGGNYMLKVQRFQAKPLTVGKPLIGAFNRAGKSYHYFQGVKDQILIPELKGVSPEAWQLVDFKGRVMKDWAGTVLMEESGESYLVVNGQPDYRYDLVVRAARPHNLTADKEFQNSLPQGELDVWNFQGKPGDFRLLEVEKKGEILARLKFAPLDRPTQERIGQPSDLPEIALLPVASRGGHLRFAALLGRSGRYQLQLLAHSPASYNLTMEDPSTPLQRGQKIDGKLPVGGAAFYSFKAVPGQLLQASLASQKFVPVLRLYDKQGSVVAGSGDDADGLEGRLTHMVTMEGLYRLQVSSLGDGGGGDFRLALTETKLKELPVGGRGQGTVQPGATDFWAFAGKAGQTVFLYVRSTAFLPTVSLRSPDGVRLAADVKDNPATGSLIALRLPRTGRYTVWISSRRGAGDYLVRLIDGD